MNKGLVTCTNTEYHAEKKHLSSSNLKLLLQEPGKFYEEKILGRKNYESKSYFDEGSYAHALILEPEVINDEFAFYPGVRKSGEAFYQFQSDNVDKIILSKPQKLRVEQWVQGYRKNKFATDLITGGIAEQSLFTTIADIDIKVRADYINLKKGYIADIKTTGFPADHMSFKHVCKSYDYPLSGALYAMAFEQYYNKPFDFYFIVLSKKDLDCQVYKLSTVSKQIGESKIYNAIAMYKDYMKNGKWVKRRRNAESQKEILEV